jgi:hypothetical protein
MSKMDQLNDFAVSKPLVTGIVATVMGWGGAIAHWLELANKFFLTFGAFFGSIGAFFTALIIIRNWWRGRNKD